MIWFTRGERVRAAMALTSKEEEQTLAEYIASRCVECGSGQAVRDHRCAPCARYIANAGRHEIRISLPSPDADVADDELLEMIAALKRFTKTFESVAARFLADEQAAEHVAN